MEIAQQSSDVGNSSPSPQPKAEKTRRRGSSPSLVILLCLILVAVAGVGGYLLRDRNAKTQSQTDAAKIAALEAKVVNLEKAAAVKDATTPSASAPAKAPSQATLDNIKDAVKSGNYAALEGFMAPSVSVIIAASDGIGDRTPAQAVSDIKYLDSGTDPWDFALSAATINSYRDGDYAKYFPETALVGKSANNHVVAFAFNSIGKISGIFMAINSDLL